MALKSGYDVINLLNFLPNIMANFVMSKMCIIFVENIFRKHLTKNFVKQKRSDEHNLKIELTIFSLPLQ